MNRDTEVTETGAQSNSSASGADRPDHMTADKITSHSGDLKDELVAELDAAGKIAPWALIVKDCNPWETKANELVLDELGVNYHVITSKMFAYWPTAPYVTVVFPSTQSQRYYDRLADLQHKITSYVEKGGTLVAHVTDDGHPCQTIWDESFLPEDVTKENRISDILTFEDPTHPIAEDVTDRDLSAWQFSAHGHLTNLPASANTIVTRSDGGQPTYVEYTLGYGRVLATMQTMEWPWQIEYGTKQLLRNELGYATEVTPLGDTE